MSTTKSDTDVLRSDYQKSVAAYWNDNPNDDRVNVLLGEIDGLYHHHYGIGDYDRSVLEGPQETRDERIIAELHRLETAQADLLLDHLGDIAPDDHLLDAGSGRGATSFMAHHRFGCDVDGVTISEYQVGFANDQAAERGVSDRVRFHFRNMLDTGFANGLAPRHLDERDDDVRRPVRAVRRVLAAAGARRVATSASPAASNDVTGRSEAVRTIDEHYTCNIHPRSEYFKALAANDLVPINVVDLTPQTIPYWELRAKSSLGDRHRGPVPRRRTARAASSTC